MMSDEEFERLVAEGVLAIPERFRARLDNVAILIADRPTKDQLSGSGNEEGEELLGLYEGVPLTERGVEYASLPDRITIFKEATLAEAEGDPDRVRAVVRETVWHEVAHYFGYDDDAVEAREAAGTNYPGGADHPRVAPSRIQAGRKQNRSRWLRRLLGLS
jgi:predicted Zn-dependent protease with MMP-like domain